MAFSTDQFRAHFSRHSDFARPSKFEARIYPPNALGGDASGLRFQCEATEFPGYNLTTVDGRIYGVAQPVAAIASFADITLTFICAGDLWEKKFFDRWMNYIAPINNYNFRYKDSYSGTLNILQFPEGPTPSPIYSVTLYNAFPISISGMQLNWSDDGIHRLPVVFKYDYWLTGGVEGANRGLKDYDKQDNVPPSGSTPPVVDGKSTSQRTTQQPPLGGRI